MGKYYSLQTIKTLFGYSGNTCAFHICNADMVNQDRCIIGEICHIEGEKPGSARYNPNMSDEQRNDFDNLILLCPTHHTTIDKNPEQYKTDGLKKMKYEHETRSKNKGYQIPDDILRIVNVSVNDDKYSLQRTHNLLRVGKGLSGNETRRLWYDHFKYMLKGLTFADLKSEDEKDGLRVLFDDLLELKNEEGMFPELLLTFLDKIPPDIKSEYIQKVNSYIETIVKKDFENPSLPHLYHYLNKSEAETLEYLINNADKLNSHNFKTLMDKSNIQFGELSESRQYLELEYRLWKKLDGLEKEKSIEQKYSVAYENITSLINKFY